MKKKQSEVAALYYLFKKLLRAMKITLFPDFVTIKLSIL